MAQKVENSCEHDYDAGVTIKKYIVEIDAVDELCKKAEEWRKMVIV